MARARGARPASAARGRSIVAAAAAAVVLGGLALGSCTSERSGIVGAELPQARFDSLLVPLRVEQLASFGNVRVTEPDSAYEDFQLLYIGRQGTEASSIVARYDFAAFADTFSQAVVDTANIKSFRLFLYLTNFYSDQRLADSTRISKYFEVLELAEAFSPDQFPGLPPATEPGRLNPELLLLDANAVLIIRLDKQKFVEWYADPAAHHGILIREADVAGNDPGLLGFAAQGFGLRGSLIDAELEGTLVGPALNVEFDEPFNTFARLLPETDLSTLEALDPIPADFGESITLRTHLRSYPYLAFDLDALPPNVFVNRAVLGLYADKLRGYGPLEAVVVSEMADGFATGGEVTATLKETMDAIERVTGQSSLDPAGADSLRFNITSSVQRHVNGNFSGPVRLLLTAAEEGFSENVGSINPDFYLRRFVFFGTDAEPIRRPFLKVFYTQLDELTGGAP